MSKPLITYSIEPDDEFIIETWSGQITGDDLAAHWKVYLADPAVMQIRRTLVDMRDAEILFYGPELSDLIQTIVAPRLGALDWKTAIIVRDAVQFGVSRQYQTFAKWYSMDSIFDNFAAAKAWLLAQK
ncbi:hypothetical protein [Prosthecobacter sp.]|uniref:hypothetical protein n=1 Tax=Prosthecobacter sp. TaxID=1965333 RepID=UPI002489D5DA|nr:hypothetical protein [Prosthecobacter sp.]MDI1315283.1 hypothetical protein [Prosthecobacter sp.]